MSVLWGRLVWLVEIGVMVAAQKVMGHTQNSKATRLSLIIEEVRILASERCLFFVWCVVACVVCSYSHHHRRSSRAPNQPTGLSACFPSAAAATSHHQRTTRMAVGGGGVTVVLAVYAVLVAFLVWVCVMSDPNDEGSLGGRLNVLLTENMPERLDRALQRVLPQRCVGMHGACCVMYNVTPEGTCLDQLYPIIQSQGLHPPARYL